MIQEKKTTSRLTSLWGLCLLCLCTVFCLLADIQVEATEQLISGDWRYEILRDGTVEITRYNGSATKIVIPEMIDEKSVTSIGAGAFSGCSSDLTIYGEAASYAEKYARREGIKFSTGKMPPPHTHTPMKDLAIAATCTKDGKTEGSHCSVCNEIIKPQEDIPVTGHTYQPTTQKATTKKNGTIKEKCSACGYIEQTKTSTIYAASDIKLSKTSFTYNDKNQKPTVTIKDSKGNKLPAGSYKITYPKTSNKFKGAKTITVKKNKTVSQSIAKLKAGKKYYVRIRTYKTIKVNGKNVKFCSGWSKVKSVKVKK